MKNSSLKIMQEVCEKLYIPQRNPKLYPFGEPTPAAAAEEVKVGMLDETQVRNTIHVYGGVVYTLLCGPSGPFLCKLWCTLTLNSRPPLISRRICI